MYYYVRIGLGAGPVNGFSVGVAVPGFAVTELADVVSFEVGFAVTGFDVGLVVTGLVVVGREVGFDVTGLAVVVGGEVGFAVTGFTVVGVGVGLDVNLSLAGVVRISISSLLLA